MPVPSAALAGRFTYGMRHWLALECEIGVANLGAARFSDVPITIDSGGSPTIADVERTTRTGRVTAPGTLRLGVVWIPTVTLGFGTRVEVSFGDLRGQVSGVHPGKRTKRAYFAEGDSSAAGYFGLSAAIAALEKKRGK